MQSPAPALAQTLPETTAFQPCISTPPFFGGWEDFDCNFASSSPRVRKISALQKTTISRSDIIFPTFQLPNYTGNTWHHEVRKWYCKWFNRLYHQLFAGRYSPARRLKPPLVLVNFVCLYPLYSPFPVPRKNNNLCSISWSATPAVLHPHTETSTR